MFFHLEEEVEEADMMDQLMEDEWSRRCSRNGRKWCKVEEHSPGRKGRTQSVLEIDG